MKRWDSMIRIAWGATLAAALLGACSAPTLAEIGSFTCAAGYQCPQGFTCNRDTKKCGLAATEPGSPDASDATVGPSDASDAAPGVDATVDASDANDATVDAGDARDARVDADATADATDAGDAATGADAPPDAPDATADAADANGVDANDGGPPDTGAPGVIQMVSVSQGGVQGLFDIVGSPSVSIDGGGVAFATASALIPQDSNGLDVYVRQGMGMLLLSQNNFAIGDGASTKPLLSSDGAYVVFHTLASNLGKPPGCILRDTVLGNNIWSLSTSTSCIPYGVSSDGRYALFSEPVDGGTALKRFDSTNSSSETITSLGDPTSASISNNGQSVAFLSTNAFQGNDTNGKPDLYMVTYTNGTPAAPVLISFASGGDPPADGVIAGGISRNGQFFWFSTVTRALASDTDSDADVYLVTGSSTLELASTNMPASGAAGLGTISDDGRYLAFEFTPSGGNKEVWVYDAMQKTTTSAHKTYDGKPPNASTELPAISGDGKWIAFVSAASNLVAVDTNGKSDVFLLPRP